jgi:hypothetical protein
MQQKIYMRSSPEIIREGRKGNFNQGVGSKIIESLCNKLRGMRSLPDSILFSEMPEHN